MITQHSPENPLNDMQRSILDKGTLLAQRLGTLRRYQDTMKKGYDQLTTGITATSDDATKRVQMIEALELTRTAHGAEAPIAFSISQLHESGVILGVQKIDSNGHAVPGSAYTIGAFPSATESPELAHDFTEADMQLAASQLKSQRAGGLSYVEYGDETRLFDLLDQLV